MGVPALGLPSGTSPAAPWRDCSSGMRPADCPAQSERHRGQAARCDPQPSRHPCSPATGSGSTAPREASAHGPCAKRCRPTADATDTEGSALGAGQHHPSGRSRHRTSGRLSRDTAALDFKRESHCGVASETRRSGKKKHSQARAKAPALPKTRPPGGPHASSTSSGFVWSGPR